MNVFATERQRFYRDMDPATRDAVYSRLHAERSTPWLRPAAGSLLTLQLAHPSERRNGFDMRTTESCPRGGAPGQLNVWAKSMANPDGEHDPRTAWSGKYTYAMNIDGDGTPEGTSSVPSSVSRRAWDEW
jgi:hypothetical protein